MQTKKYYFALYKPYDMLSQFSREENSTAKTLLDLDFVFPKDVYPIGRLDRDSEGLLLLSNDKALVHKMLHPDNHVAKTYYAQVEGEIHEKALTQLRQGVQIKLDKGFYTTKPAGAEKIETPILPERVPPIRERKNKPTSWVEMQLQEGKNRQVRKMLAGVGFPVLRLVRVQIGGVLLAEMKIGQVNELPAQCLFF